MSKTISFRGKIIPGTDAQKINLKTIKGKTGYKIKKFQIISTTPGGGNFEYIFQVYNKNHETETSVDFTDNSTLAVAYLRGSTGSQDDFFNTQTIIFDNAVFNQNIFIAGADGAGGTTACNFYLELETVKLSELESTQLTLKNMRAIASR
jgi:hypothetical protein